jgi:cyclopropane-fatty-acyl-phospholipid synthase
MWIYYLKYCEGGFLERTISTVQLVISKPHHREALQR